MKKRGFRSKIIERADGARQDHSGDKVQATPN